MAHFVDCMLRKLQHFVEHDLIGVVGWGQCRPSIPVEGEDAIVELSVKVQGFPYRVRLESSEYRPPLGRIIVNNVVMGVVDKITWDKIAASIKRHAHDELTA